MAEKKKIFICPDKESSENCYIHNLYDVVATEYDVYGMNSMTKKGLKSLLSGDVYHFNWYESMGSSSWLPTHISYFKKTTLIRILKLFNKKIVWTVHNKAPHNSKHANLDLKMLKFMAKKSDRIHILCDETRNLPFLKKYGNKIQCVCHGDYIENYPVSNVNIYDKYKIDRNKKILLFLGQIKRYKNIDLLIEAFSKSKLNNDKFVLLICGKCNDESYKKELINCNRNNIVFDFNFISDDEMSAYLKNSSLIVAPYDKQSSLNSGTLWMAMSYGKSMILPLIGCVKDFDYNKLLYVYDYNSNSEHLNHLIECMNTVYNDYENDKDIFNQKGDQCLIYVNDSITWKKNKEKWIDLYKF